MKDKNIFHSFFLFFGPANPSLTISLYNMRTLSHINPFSMTRLIC